MCGVGKCSSFILLHVAIQLFQPHLLKGLSGVFSKNSPPRPREEDFFPVFSSTSLMVSDLTFNSLIDSDLISMSEVI